MKHILLAATAVAAFAITSPANAGLLAQYSVDGGATFTPICSDASGGACSDSFTTAGGLDFLFFGAASNSPGGPSANLFSTTIRLQNTSAVQQSILLSIGDTGFTAPTGATSLLNSLSGTVVTGGAGNLASSISCIDTANGQNTCPGTYATPAINANITLPGAGAASTTLDIANLVGPFSLTENISFTLDAGALLNYVSSSDVSAVPEPASMGILGLGLLGLGTLYHRRKTG